MKLNVIKIFFFVLSLGFLVPENLSAQEANYQLPSGTNGKDLESKIELLKKIQEGMNAVITKVKPAVVFISISKYVTIPEYYYLNPFEDFFGFGGPGPRGNQRERPQKGKKFEQMGLGSGFIIDNKKGFILTNNHVVGDADEIMVHTFDGKKHKAKVIGTDEKTDVAVIQVKDLPSTLGQIYLSDSQNIQIGDWVLAVGAPHGLDQTVTRGIVSAKGRGSLSLTGYGDFIQTDAAINPGNSGGPLLNINGDAIGMNTAIFSQSGGNQGIGFAIPTNILKDIAPQLISKGKIERAFLGVLIQNLTDELALEFGIQGKEGVLVSGVEPGGPANQAGIKQGDVIFKIDGHEVKTADQLSYRVGMTAPGKKVKVEFYRKGKAQSLEVKVKAQEEGEPKNSQKAEENQSWGMGLQENRKEFGLPIQKGLVVTQVEEGSPAQKGGVQEGDVILEVNQNEVNKIKDFQKFDNRKDSILLRIARGKYYLFVNLKK